MSAVPEREQHMAIDDYVDGFTRASPVTIYRADGTVEVKPPYTADELQAIVYPGWKKVDKAKWAALMRLRREEAKRGMS